MKLCFFHVKMRPCSLSDKMKCHYASVKTTTLQLMRQNFSIHYRCVKTVNPLSMRRNKYSHRIYKMQLQQHSCIFTDLHNVIGRRQLFRQLLMREQFPASYTLRYLDSADSQWNFCLSCRSGPAVTTLVDGCINTANTRRTFIEAFIHYDSMSPEK